MKQVRIALLFLVLFILMSACSAESAALSASVIPPAADSPAAPTVSPIPAVKPLYNGPYSNSVLPQSIPVISEYDKKAFNPDKVYDYLAGSDFADHEYFIKGAELKGGTLYLTIKDNMYFYEPSLAYDYLKDKFSLTDETILRLPEFSGCYIQYGILNACDDVLRFESRILAPVPVPKDVCICKNASEISLADFTEFLLNGKSKNDELAIHTEFDYIDGQLTINYCDSERYGVPVDRERLTNDVYDPTVYGYGSLPKSLLGVNDTDTETFDPNKVKEYLLLSPVDLEHYYNITDMQFSGGHLTLLITDSITVDSDAAYQYLKECFSLTENDIMELPLFSGCSVHNGIMYTQEQWDYENGIEPEGCEEYNMNGIPFEDIVLSVPVADSAEIILVDNDDTGKGYYLTVPQFIEYLQNMKAKEGTIDLYGIWFKYSNNEITALIEEYIP